MSQTDFTFLKKYAPTTALVLLALMSISFVWFSYNKQAQTSKSLKVAAKALREGGDIADYLEFVKKFDDARVTVIDKDGGVTADNRADQSAMANHADRPEFIMATENYFGEDVRKSETTGKKTIYVMTRLNDGNYIRLAQPVELTYEFLVWLFAPIIFLSFCLAVMMFAFAKNRQMERLRREFVANVSHELKTPLTSIKGFAELISAGLVKDGDTIMEYQQKIVTQSNRLLAMINDILHLSKLESSKPKTLTPVDTRVVANQVKESLKTLADEKGIIVQVLGTGKVLAEAEPIYQMIYNLVDNGIKYGKNGGFVKIILDDKKIIVSDNGIGIPAQDIERVFERFYRVDKSRSPERGGTGLGLAIVKHTAQQYGGTVSIKSNDGTQVCIEFKA